MSKRYLVNGIVQMEIKAASAQDAVRIAERRAMSLENRYSGLTVSLDNICTDVHESVGFDEAAHLDEVQA